MIRRKTVGLNSRNSKYLAVLVIGLVGLSGCNRMADEELCERAYQHIFELKNSDQPESVKKVKADQSTDTHLEFLKACVGKESEERIQCFLSSTTTHAISECKNAE